MGRTEARAKWMNSPSRKEKRATVLKIAMARQEDLSAAGHPDHDTVVRTRALPKQALSQAP